MKEIKAGDAVVIGGEGFKIPEESVLAINIWLECLESGVSDEGVVDIPLLSGDGRRYGYFRPSKIKEALERAESNKTPLDSH